MAFKDFGCFRIDLFVILAQKLFCRRRDLFLTGTNFQNNGSVDDDWHPLLCVHFWGCDFNRACIQTQNIPALQDWQNERTAIRNQLNSIAVNISKTVLARNHGSRDNQHFVGQCGFAMGRQENKNQNQDDGRNDPRHIIS